MELENQRKAEAAGEDDEFPIPDEALPDFTKITVREKHSFSFNLFFFISI